MQSVIASPLGLDQLDAGLLAQLQSSGAAANFVITPHGQR
jgi:hypothetical protein